MSRIPRIVAIGYPHHVIQRGNNRQLIFFDDEDRQAYIRLLKKYSNECSCKVHSYCLMNNHVHLLLTPENVNSLSKTMQKLSLVFTQYANKKYERTGRIWECRFHSSVVDKEKYLWTVCRYIERNPVRVQLVKNPAEYLWSSAKFRGPSKHGDDFLEPIWSDDCEKEEYFKFLSQSDNEEEIDSIRKAVYRGSSLY